VDGYCGSLPHVAIGFNDFLDIAMRDDLLCRPKRIAPLAMRLPDAESA
jgi:hypothetical protein